MREQPGAWPAALDRERGHWHLHHALTAPAGQRRPNVPDDFETAGDVVENFADILANLAHRATARGASAVRGMDDLTARQMLRQGAPTGRLLAHDRAVVLVRHRGSDRPDSHWPGGSLGLQLVEHQL